MLGVLLSCPSCQTQFQLSGVAGQSVRVKCPKCAVVFEASATQPPSIIPTLSGSSLPSGQRETTSGRTQDGTKDGATNRGFADKNLAGELAHAHLRPAQCPDELGRLGPYRILKVLGKGGMGLVYQAEDPRLKRQIALKIMLPRIAADATARQRFKREAQAQGVLEHDHIITIYEVEEDNGVPYIAMPLLKGELLSTCLQREGKLPVAEILRIGREMAEGLAAAHQRKMIHRDIKPGNIWLETRSSTSQQGGGRVKILDFGLARLETATHLAEHLTAIGRALGTPAYMSPEQAQGSDVTPRTDLFSLGCVLYEMATGELPFKGKDAMAILSSLALHDPTPPHQINTQIPPAISDLVLRLLAKNPHERLGSAREVVEIIQLLEKTFASVSCTSADTQARPASAPPATKENSQRQPNATQDPWGQMEAWLQQQKEEEARQQQQAEQKLREQELERLRQDGEAKLVQFISQALDRSQGKPSQDDTAAARDICKLYGVSTERAKHIVDDVRQKWKKDQAAKKEQEPLGLEQAAAVQEAERKFQEQQEAERKQKELESLRQEGESKLMAVLREELEYNDGFTQQVANTVSEISKQYQIDAMRSQQILNTVHHEWQCRRQQEMDEATARSEQEAKQRRERARAHFESAAKLMLGGVVLLLIGWGLWKLLQSTNGYEREMQNGQRALNDKRYPEAVKAFESALNSKSTDQAASAMKQIADVASKAQRNRSEALESAQGYIQARKPQEADGAWNMASKADEALITALAKAGITGEPDSTIATTRTAIDQLRRTLEFEGHLRDGVLVLMKGEQNQAEELFGKAASIKDLQQTDNILGLRADLDKIQNLLGSLKDAQRTLKAAKGFHVQQKFEMAFEELQKSADIILAAETSKDKRFDLLTNTLNGELGSQRDIMLSEILKDQGGVIAARKEKAEAEYAGMRFVAAIGYFTGARRELQKAFSFVTKTKQSPFKDHARQQESTLDKKIQEHLEKLLGQIEERFKADISTAIKNGERAYADKQYQKALADFTAAEGELTKARAVEEIAAKEKPLANSLEIAGKGFAEQWNWIANVGKKKAEGQLALARGLNNLSNGRARLRLARDTDGAELRPAKEFLDKANQDLSNAKELLETAKEPFGTSAAKGLKDAEEQLLTVNKLLCPFVLDFQADQIPKAWNQGSKPWIIPPMKNWIMVKEKGAVGTLTSPPNEEFPLHFDLEITMAVVQKNGDVDNSPIAYTPSIINVSLYPGKKSMGPPLSIQLGKESAAGGNRATVGPDDKGTFKGLPHKESEPFTLRLVRLNAQATLKVNEKEVLRRKVGTTRFDQLTITVNNVGLLSSSVIYKVSLKHYEGK